MIPKFRACDVNSKEIVAVARIEFDSETIFIANNNKSINDYQTLGLWRVFKSFILMQSTGLHDKNGVEIFEGDLIHYTYEGFDWYVPVVYKKGRFEVYHGTLSTIPVSEIPSGEYATNIGNSIRMYRAEFTDMYVAGNIYENPELLEDV